jgi:hypothetical protein
MLCVEFEEIRGGEGLYLVFDYKTKKANANRKKDRWSNL